MNAALCNSVFNRCIQDYHRTNSVDADRPEPFAANSIEALLYLKNWIDTVQWHLEDIIRDPELSGEKIMELKRRIDRSNQERTDLVERIDDWFLHFFKGTKPKPDARMNSETPAWLVDRMSILALKVYHMKEQTERTDVGEDHLKRCNERLSLLNEQTNDLATALDQLMEDIRSGVRFMKVYRQVKMYNDSSLNPSLYGKKVR